MAFPGAPLTPLATHPPVGCFDITLSKAGDGSLGVIVRENGLLRSSVNQKRVISYKATAMAGGGSAKESGPAERCGFMRENDILIGVCGSAVTDMKFDETVNMIRAAPAQLHMRVLRPRLQPEYKGVAMAAAAFPPELITGLSALPYAAVLHDGHGAVHVYGPFASASEAAAAYDCVVLAAYGTRAAVHTNSYAHMASFIARAEVNAAHAAATGDVAGVIAHLGAVGADPYTYAGVGYIAPPPLQHRKLNVDTGDSDATSWSDVAPGVAMRYHVRAATAQEAASRARDASAPAHLAAIFPGIGLLADRSFLASQWSRESIPISNETNELIRARLMEGVAEADIAHAAFSAVDDEDDGAGHADVAPPAPSPALDAAAFYRIEAELHLSPAALLDEVTGVSWVVDSGAMRAAGHAVGSNGLPLPLLKAPWGPRCAAPAEEAARAQVSLGDDVWASSAQKNGAARADRVRCVQPTVLYKVHAGAATPAVSSVIVPSPHEPLPASAALVTGTAACAVDSVRSWAMPPSVQARIKAVGKDVDTRHSIFRNVYWDREHVGAYAVLHFSDAQCQVLCEDGSAPAVSLVMNHYRTAVQAALAYDRIVRRMKGKGGVAVTHFNTDAKLQSQLLTIAWKHTLFGRPELFGVDATAYFATGSPLIDQSQLTDAACLIQSAMTATPPGSTMSRLSVASMVGALTSPHINPLAHLIRMPASAPPPAPPPVLQFDDAAAMLMSVGVTEAMAAEEHAFIRATITAEQREIIRQQIMIMKELTKGDVPTPATISLATRFNDPAMKQRLKQILNGDNDARFGAGRSGNRTRTGKIFTGRKKRKYKKRAAEDDDDEEVDDEDLDDTDSEAEGWDGARPGGNIRRSGRERKSQGGAGPDDGEEDYEEGGDGESGDERRAGPRRKRKAKRNGATSDGEGGPPVEEAAAEQWRIDVILAARYADLPTEEVIDSSLSEEEQAKRHDAIQLRLRQALPQSMRREWTTLEFMVRWKGLSYLHVEWVTSTLIKEQGTWGVIKARKFSASPDCARQLDEEEERMAAGRDPPLNESYFDEDLIAVERIIASKEVPAEELGETEGDLSAPRTMYLVKWRALGYSECTWEKAEDIKDDSKVALFQRYDARPLDDAIAKYDSAGLDIRPPASEFVHLTESPAFKEGRRLRDYQLEGVNWLVHNWYHRRNSILADEMGLGKTVQSVATLEHLRSNVGVRGPFLVLAPLSTLGHWKREFDEWTDMHTVYYHEPLGGASARAMIREHEWRFSGPAGARLASQGVYKFNTLITSYHVLLSDWEHFEPIRWRYVVVDEAHSLKNRDSQLQQALQVMRYDNLLLLTGTPLQNDVQELWALLNLINDKQFHSLGHFIGQYGELKDSSQVVKLQKELAPIMLRRAKEDVEKSIPPKEETLINVELTRLQKAYYRAVLERNRGFLMRGAGSNTASLVNVEMELRKCCDHPFLLKGAEARETMHCTTREERVDAMVAASGKMVLLDKLFPKLRSEGHRVLIFSQFKTMLTLIEELLSTRGYKYERIDGSIRGNERQAAIDRYNIPGSDVFAFLLSTKAGGQGINLTTADTVIIFDSDWNPQNDVQAMARAHRIGQTKDVSIYRLLTAKTYEAEMFRRASRKLGLSQAVFESGGGVSKNFGEDGDGQELSGLLAMDKEKVEALLRFGAYAIMDDDDANAAAAQFQSSTIDQILSKSATIRYEDGAAVMEGEEDEEGGAAGGRKRRGGVNLSKATFAVDEGEKLDVQDPSFWEKVLGPKAGDSVLAALHAGVLSDPIKTLQWTADLTALLDDVFEARCNGTAHDAAESLQTLLAELMVVGKTVPHPLSDEGRARIPADTPAEFPDPTVTLNTVLQAETLVSARMRARAANGRGSPPDVDGDGEQHKGSFATFAEYWMDRVEQGRRSRKRVRGELPVAMIAGSGVSSSSAGGGGSRGGGAAGRGRGRGGGGDAAAAPAFRGSRHGYDDDDFMFDDAGAVGGGGGSDDDYVSAAGKKRSRSSAVVARETQDEGEEEVKEVDGVAIPSVSQLRIRLTPVVAPSGHFTPTVIALGPQSKNAHTRPSAWTPEHVRRPQAEIDAAATAADGDTGADATDAAAAAASAQGAVPPAAAVPLLGSVLDAGQRARLSGYRNLLMPASMLVRTGFTQAEMIAAADAGRTVAEVAADARLTDAATAPEATEQLSTLLADQAACAPYAEAEKARAVRVKAWLRMNRDAAAPNPVPRMPAPTPAVQPGMLTVPVLPYRVACVYSANSSRVMKPVDSKGPRGLAPTWVTQGIAADVNDQIRRAARKAAQNARRAAQRQSARAAAAAAAFADSPMDMQGDAGADDYGDGAGEEDMDEDVEPARGGTMPAPDDVCCCVCNLAEGTQTDPIVVCDGCNIAVHRLCYGIGTIPPGREPYFCSVCTARRIEAGRAGVAVTPLPDALPCALCNLTGGAYKRVASTEPPRLDASGKPMAPLQGWVHVVCALWSPTASFADTLAMEQVQGCAAARASADWSMTCTICNAANAGVCIKCSSPACDVRFHAMCGRRTNLRMELTRSGQLRGYCSAHTAPAAPPPIAAAAPGAPVGAGIKTIRFA